MNEKVVYRQPGEGAILFAYQFIDGLTKAEFFPVIQQVINGQLHNVVDKRIKRCDYCGYFWRDISLRNNKRKCSADCERSLKTLQKREQRALKELLNPKPKKAPDMYTYYADHLEYPYFLSEQYMLKRSYRFERPKAPDKLAQIDAAEQRGYKRKSKATPTDGSDTVYIKGISHKHRYGEVEASQLEEGYFERKYSERHQKLERWRAENFKLATK
ncbi:hypothetical protein [Peribacillus glennii]|uniref:Uncharacterized protein n=1 Tax=Peribacillus glennii TaxID=2303991 RepID=A0A372L6U9_9BACI|nr:hypothetical protein [Peribacillus glennii]RFU60526.1 hypothetical protein D0466_21110 [Peribacillus glennii]